MEFKAEETVSRPHFHRFKLQGKNRVLVRVHQNEEYKTEGGIIIADTRTTQSKPNTGTVLMVSEDFDTVAYPSVETGSYVFCTHGAWHEFDNHGERLAVVNAEHVLFVYKFE